MEMLKKYMTLVMVYVRLLVSAVWSWTKAGANKALAAGGFMGRLVAAFLSIIAAIIRSKPFVRAVLASIMGVVMLASFVGGHALGSRKTKMLNAENSQLHLMLTTKDSTILALNSTVSELQAQLAAKKAAEAKPAPAPAPKKAAAPARRKSTKSSSSSSSSFW